MPREDNLTHEQQRFAVPRPVQDDKPRPFAQPLKPQPAAEKPDEPEIEDFLVSVPPRTERQSFMSAPPLGNFKPDPSRAIGRIKLPGRPDVPETNNAGAGQTAAKPPQPEEEKTPAIKPINVTYEVKNKLREGEKTVYEPLDSGVRVIGECFHTYIIAEDKDGLILIDKHAAHERILFNKMRAETVIPQQQLLTPVVVELTGEEAAAIQEQLDDIRKAGFAIDPFGENSFAVRSVPAYIESGDVQSVISELAEKAMNSRATVPDRLDDLIHMVACKAAIKAGRGTSMIELQSLCERVLSDENVRSCPHGRPTTVRLTKYELDKMFKRVNQ